MPHPHFASEFFARFTSPQGIHIDVMAGIRVRRASSMVAWDFDPTTIVQYEGLPWMLLEQWHELYSLFGRVDRAQRIRAYLNRIKNRDQVLPAK